MLELLHIKWEITPSSTLFSQRHTRPHPPISATAPRRRQTAARRRGRVTWRRCCTTTRPAAWQSGWRGAKEASSFIQHQGGVGGGGLGGFHPHQSFISRLFLLTAAICNGEEEDGGRLGGPTGTEMREREKKKKDDGKVNQKWVSYLHPFFFMIFPSTTSALRGRERRGGRVEDFENRQEW